MNAPEVTSFVLPTTQALGLNSVAAVTLRVRWSDGVVAHEEEWHVPRFSVLRESLFLPKALGNGLFGLGQGQSVHVQLSAGEATDAWLERDCVTLPRHAFDTQFIPGVELTPKLGRFYPQGVIHGWHGVNREDRRPLRVLAVDAETITVDLNHPMSRYPLEVELAVDSIDSEQDLDGGFCAAPLDQLLEFTGMAASLADGSPIDYLSDADSMRREDVAQDAEFYAQPRMLQHLDARALHSVNALYQRLLPRQAAVLDLMASHDSHLQGVSLSVLHVLGMNAEELEANAFASTRTVQDLNQRATLPCANNSLDAVVCTVSVEYLTKPLAVFAEVLRTLKPGGVFVLTFSNRWFPSKAIAAWSLLQDFERVGLVSQWLAESGFERLQTFSSRNWSRPADDAYAAQIQTSDPVYAAWGYKPQSTQAKG
jgi:SAM-dependent methyltransferase/FKBP-type peptidyl-prolyl cis-trans isomerase 2